MKYFLIFCLFVVACSSESVGEHNTPDIKDYPYLVSILQPGSGGRRHVCAGAILNTYYILTTAKCIEVFDDPHAYHVRTGSAHNDRTSMISVDYMVVEKFMHPQYLDHKPEYNIGLLKVNTPIVFNDVTASIEMVDDNFKYEDEIRGVVAGWSPSVARAVQSFLGALEIKTVDREKCENENIHLTTNMLCSDLIESTGCHYDSGSPVVVNNKIAAVTTEEIGCKSGMAGILTKLNKDIKSWIQEKIVV